MLKVPVSLSTVKIEPVVGRGSLIGLAIVDLDVGGAIVTLQGVQVTRTPDGGLACKSPVWRHPLSGRWLPGVTLPPELAEALAADVLGLWMALHGGAPAEDAR